MIQDDDKLLRIQSESFEISENMLFENLNEDFENKDSSDEEALKTETLESNIVFTQENVENSGI